jgi:hypothetical protein
MIRWKAIAIQRVAKLAAASPELRLVLIRVLNRVPRVKRRLKQVLSHASTIASQDVRSSADGDADDLFLSRHARRSLQDLHRARARVDAERNRMRAS